MEIVTLQVWQDLMSADHPCKQIQVEEDQSGDLAGSGQPAINLICLHIKPV